MPDQPSESVLAAARLLNLTFDAIFATDVDGRRITFWNAGAVRMYGYSADEAVGQVSNRLLRTRTAGSLEAGYDRLALTGQWDGRLVQTRKDGVEVIVDGRWVLDEDSATILEVNREVTEQVAAGERFELLVESVRDYAIYLLDVDGHVATWNDGARRIKGYTIEEIVGRHVSIFYPPDDVAAGKPARDLETAMKVGRFEDECWRLRKDGTRFWASIVITPVRDSSGKLTGYAKVTRDVTEKLELRSQQAARLESLGQLAGGVAHDFNNLLAVILNLTEQVKTALAQPGSETARESLRDMERIDKAAQSASRLTKQLLAFARQQFVQPVAVDVGQQVTSWIDVLRRTLGSHIFLSAEMPAGLWPVMIDPGQLEQIVINLAVNSRDAMPKGGKLSISASNFSADESFAHARPGLEPGRYVRLQVADSGSGMDRAALAHAFEPFFTTKGPGHGTGLGLATIYGIVRQARGHVSIYSEPGHGTTVTVLIPTTDALLPTPPPPVSAHAGPATGTILVVEDYADLRELLMEVLTGAGYQVLLAPDGGAALELARKHRGEIDVLLTDIVMPNMLGPDLAEQLRKESPGLAILFMSGHAQPVLGNSMTLPPDMPLLQKPFMAAELLAKLDQVLAARPLVEA